MTGLAHNTPFLMDKQGFFSINAPETGLAYAQKRASQQEYDFLARHRTMIEQEFNDLFNALKNKPDNHESFWLYCYYLSLMLHSYYQAYGKRSHANKYNAFAKDIAHFYEHKTFPSNAVVKQWQEQLKHDLGELASTPRHVEKIRDWVAFTNITRMQIVFSRLAIKQSLVILQGSHLLELIDAFLGKPTDVGGMMSMLDAPTGVFNVLSVGVFVARFALNMGMLLKHIFIPNDAEKKLPLGERFTQELAKRHCDMLNDLVWGTVNGLTNYASYFNISAPVANWIMAGFLLFDVSLLFYRKRLAEQSYMLKKEQYEQEIKELDLGSPSRVLLEAQLAELERNWQATNATYWFNVSAALLLMTGFSASLLLANPVAAPVCFLVCAVAIAMYISGDLYGNYHEKHLLLQQAEQEGRDSTHAYKALQEARSEFITSMVKNTVMPMLIMGVFAVSWPAALALTVLFIGYESTKGYFKQNPTPELELKEDKSALVDSSCHCF